MQEFVYKTGICLSMQLSYVYGFIRLTNCRTRVNFRWQYLPGQSSNNLECDFGNSTICGWSKAGKEEIMRWTRIAISVDGMIYLLFVWYWPKGSNPLYWRRLHLQSRTSLILNVEIMKLSNKRLYMIYLYRLNWCCFVYRIMFWLIP